VEDGFDVQEAAENALRYMHDKIKGNGGVIA
jgi:hypothetical protein